MKSELEERQAGCKNKSKQGRKSVSLLSSCNLENETGRFACL